MISGSLHVDSHEVTSGEVQGAEHFASQVRGDDGVFSLRGLRRHAQVESIHIGGSNGHLGVPERVTGTDGKMIKGGILGVVGAGYEAPVNGRSNEIADSLNL